MTCGINLKQLASFLLINREKNQLGRIGSTRRFLGVQLSNISSLLSQNIPSNLSPIFLKKLKSLNSKTLYPSLAISFFSTNHHPDKRSNLIDISHSGSIDKFILDFFLRDNNNSTIAFDSQTSQI